MSCHCKEHRAPITSMAGLKAMIEPSRAIRPFLVEVRCDLAQWRTLLRCRECGRYWIEEYPWGELQGGGPTVLLPIPSTDVEAHFRATADLVPALRREVDAIRREHEDKEFWATLGAETGPNSCNEPGCGRLRVKHSVFCPLHHFKMIKGRPPPAD
jgi:hypothetical protein